MSGAEELAGIALRVARKASSSTMVEASLALSVLLHLPAIAHKLIDKADCWGTFDDPASSFLCSTSAASPLPRVTRTEQSCHWCSLSLPRNAEGASVDAGRVAGGGECCCCGQGVLPMSLLTRAAKKNIRFFLPPPPRTARARARKSRKRLC